jgi:hypothetical protein
MQLILHRAEAGSSLVVKENDCTLLGAVGMIRGQRA